MFNRFLEWEIENVRMQRRYRIYVKVLLESVRERSRENICKCATYVFSYMYGNWIYRTYFFADILHVHEIFRSHAQTMKLGDFFFFLTGIL